MIWHYDMWMILLKISSRYCDCQKFSLRSADFWYWCILPKIQRILLYLYWCILNIIYIHIYIHAYIFIYYREREGEGEREREREYTNASSFSWLKCSVVTECNRSLCQQSVCFCEPASLLTILDLHKPCRWVCNNAGSVLKLQVIIGILSLIFYVCTFTCFICGNSWDLRTLWFWKLNKNESLRVLQPLFYLHLTCVNN